MNKKNAFTATAVLRRETARRMEFSYTHKRLLSAYRSLKNNLQYLFTWYDNFDLKIPA
jgi:hypothetical protein